MMSAPSAIKVLVLSNSLARGGAERFAARLVSGLDPNRIQVRMVLLRGASEYSLPNGTPVEVLDYRGPAHLLRTVWRLRRTIQSIRPDVVLGAGSSVNVVAGAALSSLRRRPKWIARVDTYRRALWFRQWLLRLLYPKAHRIVANASAMQRALVQAYPRLRSKIISIYNPLDFNEIDHLSRRGAAWRQTSKAPLLITVGHASHAKRWDILIRAFQRVVRITPAELVLCGDGPLLNRHKQLAGELDLQGRVHFLGHCRNPFPLLAAADLFVFSSEAEGLPNALIEAQGLGLCAVATRCDFGPEEIVVDGLTGRLVPVNDAAALAAAITRLLLSPALRKTMGRAASEQARRRFESGPICAAWEALIAQGVDPA